MPTVDPSVLIQAAIDLAAIGATTKVTVDILRMSFGTADMPPYAAPLMAVLGGFFWSIVYLVAQGLGLTPQLIAQALLTGIGAAGAALGITGAARYADKVRSGAQ